MVFTDSTSKTGFVTSLFTAGYPAGRKAQIEVLSAVNASEKTQAAFEVRSLV